MGQHQSATLACVTTNADPAPPVIQDVDVERARPPATTEAAAGYPFQSLQTRQQRHRTERCSHPDDRIQEPGLARLAEGCRCIKAGARHDANAAVIELEQQARQARSWRAPSARNIGSNTQPDLAHLHGERSLVCPRIGLALLDERGWLHKQLLDCAVLIRLGAGATRSYTIVGEDRLNSYRSFLP